MCARCGRAHESILVRSFRVDGNYSSSARPILRPQAARYVYKKCPICNIRTQWAE